MTRQSFTSRGRKFHVGQRVSCKASRGAPIALQHRTWAILAQAPDPLGRRRSDGSEPSGSGSWLWLQDVATGAVDDRWIARVSWLEPA